MTDRISSEHSNIPTVRGRLVRHAGRRLRLELPDDPEIVQDAAYLTAILDGQSHVARLHAIDGVNAIVGLFYTQAAASAGDMGADRLQEWVARHKLRPPDSVAIDVIEPGERVGIRLPGDRATYRVTPQPDPTLASIAERFTDGR